MAASARNILNLNQEDIKRHFRKRGYDSSKPMLFSIDGDKTIIDRDRGPHFISDAVISMFKVLGNDHHFLLSMNTGRDYTNYSPIERKTNHKSPNVFLSGRVIHYENEVYIDQLAVLPRRLKSLLWEMVIRGDIPFIDAKDGTGNRFYVSRTRNFQALYGHHRPRHWFDELDATLLEISDVDSKKDFIESPIVRIEMPFMAGAAHDSVISAINRKDTKKIRSWFKEIFGSGLIKDLSFIPAPTHASHGQALIDSVASVRIVVNELVANKGTGLKSLIENLNITQGNVIYFGDSAEDKANDAIVKQILPNATLIITDNGEQEAKKFADFVTDSVALDGVPRAVELIKEFHLSQVGKTERMTRSLK